MEDIDRLREDAHAGRIDSDRLVDLIVMWQRQLQAANRQLQAALKRIAELEKQLGGAATAKVAEPFSMRAEEQRQEKRGKKKRRRNGPQRRGRLKTADKIKR